MRNHKNRKISFLANLLTIGVVAMVITSGPSQAMQIKINTDNLNNLQVGETGFFYINITIGSNEKIPVSTISVENLPDIEGSPNGLLVFNVSDFIAVGDTLKKGNYSISLIYRHGWVGGYGYGYGYGYNHEIPPYYGYGYGYRFYGYGYGYGYEEGNSDTYTQLRYKVTVDTTGAEPGTYDAVVNVNTDRNISFRESTSFTLMPSPPTEGSISGYAINDSSGNGEWDAGETGISGLRIRMIGIVDKDNGHGSKLVKEETLTDDAGYYRFDNLSEGIYIVWEKNLKGWLPTGSIVMTVPLEQGEHSVNNNFTSQELFRAGKPWKSMASLNRWG